MKNSTNLVSVITVNYNGLDDTFSMLKSVYAANISVDFEVIVVDNGSETDPTESLKKAFPDVIVIRSEKNLGFAGGNNLGVAQAKGNYLFFVNNDTEFSPSLTDKLIEAFSAEKNVGGVSPKIYYYDHPGMIQFAGFTPIHAISGRNSTIGTGEMDEGQYDNVKEIPYLHGAAMMISKDAIDKAGLMYEDFFLYYEEMDWSQRIRNAGFRLLYVPEATIVHKESAAVNKISDLKLYYHTRNRMLFMKRNTGSFHNFIFILYFLLVVFPLHSIKYLLKGEPNSIKVFFKGILGYFRFGKV